MDQIQEMMDLSINTQIYWILSCYWARLSRADRARRSKLLQGGADPIVVVVERRSRQSVCKIKIYLSRCKIYLSQDATSRGTRAGGPRTVVKL